MIITNTSGFDKKVVIFTLVFGICWLLPVGSQGTSILFIPNDEFQVAWEDEHNTLPAATSDLSDEEVRMKCLEETPIKILPNTVVSIRENTIISTVQTTDWAGTDQIVYVPAANEMAPGNRRPEPKHVAVSDTVRQTKTKKIETKQLVEDQQRTITNLPIQSQQEPVPFTQTIVPASGLMMQKTAKDHKYLLTVHIDPVSVGGELTFLSSAPCAYSNKHLPQHQNKSPPSANGEMVK